MHVIAPILLLLLLAFTTNGHALANAQGVTQNLPPDPGPAGKETLEGIDSDNDGVRDDIQRRIALVSPNSQKMKTALTQYAKAMQNFLLDENDPVIIFNNALQMNRSMYCIVYVDSSVNSIELMSEFHDRFLNTYERSKTWLQADRHLSGKFFSVPKNKKSGCDFDPDAMPN